MNSAFRRSPELNTRPLAGHSKEKPSRREREGLDRSISRLRADDVAGLKAFGALEQIELYGLPLVE
jgi:hypothetical protein